MRAHIQPHTGMPTSYARSAQNLPAKESVFSTGQKSRGNGNATCIRSQGTRVGCVAGFGEARNDERGNHMQVSVCVGVCVCVCVCVCVDLMSRRGSLRGIIL